MEDNINIAKGSGNIFADLGFDRPEEELAKARLASQINDIIKKRDLTQIKAADILGIDQPKISALKNGRLGGYSIERLLSFLIKLNRSIAIIVRIPSNNKPHINVLTE